jgi:hypothetical protein
LAFSRRRVRIGTHRDQLLDRGALSLFAARLSYNRRQNTLLERARTGHNAACSSRGRSAIGRPLVNGHRMAANPYFAMMSVAAEPHAERDAAT